MAEAGQDQVKQLPLRICYFGTYRQDYSRNRIMIEGLRQNGVYVIECHEELWTSIEDRVDVATGGWAKPGFMRRVLRAYARLIYRYLRMPRHDLVVVGYPGQLDVLLARLLSWLRGKHLAYDVFMSVYLIALERGLDRQSPASIQLLRCLEWLSLRTADLLILDTAQYMEWMVKTHRLPSQPFNLIPTGADDRVFRPQPNREPDGTFRAIYYGTFIQNHGVPYIIEAAKLLKNDPQFRFELIGFGPEWESASALVQQYGLQKQVRLLGWSSPEVLVEHVANSDACLGAFGFTPQSLMTVQNKIFECIAMNRPVITGDSPALRNHFVDGRHLLTCDRADPASLASALRRLHADPDLRQRLAGQGLAHFQDLFSLRCIGQRFKISLGKLIGPNRNHTV